jgi:glutamyl-tRNA synthetase
VRLGWSHGDQEIFSLEEMIALFDPKDINKSASSYNLDKLLWLNAHYIKNTPNEKLAQMLKEFGVDIAEHDKLEILLDATKERGKTLVELAEQIKLILNAPTAYDPKAVKKAFKGDAKEILTDFIAMLQTWEKPLHLPSDYHEVLEAIVAEKEIGFGKIGMPLRVALVGALTGAGVDEMMAIIGVDETIERIENVLRLV